METVREQILNEISRAKRANPQRWFLWFNNFGLYTKPARDSIGITEYFEEHPEEFDMFYHDTGRTHRQFFEDIDRVFVESGNHELMVERTERKVAASNEGLDEAERLLAETYIEPYIRMIELGYTRDILRG